MEDNSSKLDTAATKVLMLEQANTAIKTQVTPYYDLFNRCTKAVIKEIDSKKTKIDATQARQAVNFLDAYGTLIHQVITNPKLQESIVDFVIQMEENK